MGHNHAVVWEKLTKATCSQTNSQFNFSLFMMQNLHLFPIFF